MFYLNLISNKVLLKKKVQKVLNFLNYHDPINLIIFNNNNIFLLNKSSDKVQG